PRPRVTSHSTRLHPASVQSLVRPMPRQRADRGRGSRLGQPANTTAECSLPLSYHLNFLAVRLAECPEQRAHTRPPHLPGPYRPKPRKRPVPERHAAASLDRSAWRGRYPNPRAFCCESFARRRSATSHCGHALAPIETVLLEAFFPNSNL